jgi:hypothetical protein
MKRFSILAVVSLLALALVMPATVAASTHRSTSIPATGSLLDAGGNVVGSFDGVANITNVTRNNGVLSIAGTLSGDLLDASGNVVRSITDQAFTSTLNLTGGTQGRCQILFLDLGPIFLDLLGLEVSLSQVELDVTAVRGPGNLLGNLLCAVAGLLDRGGPLSGIDNLLRSIGRILG